jgi:leucyl/phenylalanyl-tRNA--protein transferase
MIRLPQLEPFRFRFPPVETALDDPNGLLAFGGDLRPGRLLAAYRQGIFPWYDDNQPILWWSPDPRAVLLPDQIHISRSLRKSLRRSTLRVSMDRDFDGVIAGCAARSSTWITREMREAYRQLHRLGHAHSVEVWSGDQLVGGLYGIAIGQVFFGESMFSRVSDASKIALVHLCRQLQQWQFRLIDCQVGNDHTRSLGASAIPRRKFIQLLGALTPLNNLAGPSPWKLEWFWPEQNA